MATQIVEIGGHKFICGLFWQSLSRPRELWREASELGKRIESDLMVLRFDQTVAQAGYAQTRDGARRGLLSLGAVVSKTIAMEGAVYEGQQQPVHNWLSAFKLPNGMWAYFAARDANFLPNGDFAGTKEEVLDRLHGDYGLGGWNAVIGDKELEEYGFHNFNARSIDELIPKRKSGKIRTHRWWALRPVDQRLSWKPVAAGAALTLVGIAAGGLYWHHHLQDLERQRLADLELARQKRQEIPLPVKEVHPWSNIPRPADLAHACVDNFNRIVPAGWALDSYECVPEKATYSWSRGMSNVGYLLEQLPDAVIQLNGEKATYDRPLRQMNGVDDELLAADNLLHVLMARLQVLGLTLQLTAAQPAAPNAIDSSLAKIGAVPARPERKTFSFNLNAGGLPLMEVAEIFSRPGVRFNKISYRDGKWSIEGAIYAK